jgi:hypothetical protein
VPATLSALYDITVAIMIPDEECEQQASPDLPPMGHPGSGDGIASFDRIRYRRHDADVFMWASDLVELNGDDLRRDPLAVRKATLERMIAHSTGHMVQ